MNEEKHTNHKLNKELLHPKPHPNVIEEDIWTFNLMSC